ncbi:hypothetical protein [Kistimonas asteriae]|uniref:hypothetical protein n=1 Tax=Kistimonas asteriae TaxID=517724 RepID=UPI001BAB6349|nr:hypothetical protein [Kistimonas asteriae]
MPIGVIYRFDQKECACRFCLPGARLPVLTRDGEMQLLLWGRRRLDACHGDFPFGGWARLHNIQGGRWNRFSPVPVKIPAQAFFEQDVSGQEHRFPVTEGQYLQGLVSRIGREQRVYVVTLETSLDDMCFERWPRLVASVT